MYLADPLAGYPDLLADLRERGAPAVEAVAAFDDVAFAFGEDFDLHEFTAAYASEDPVALNRVKAVERGVDQLYNYVAELTAFGLELAEVRARDDELKRAPGPTGAGAYRRART